VRASPKEDLWLLNTADRKNLKIWLKAFDSAIQFKAHKDRAFAGKSVIQAAMGGGPITAAGAGFTASENAQLDMIDSLLDSLHDKAVMIGTEADKESQLIKGMQKGVTTTEQRLKAQKKGVEGLQKGVGAEEDPTLGVMTKGTSLVGRAITSAI